MQTQIEMMMLEAGRVIWQWDPDLAHTESRRVSVWLVFPTLPSPSWKIVIIFSITKKMYSI